MSVSIDLSGKQRSVDESGEVNQGLRSHHVRRPQSITIDDPQSDRLYSWIACHQLILSSLQGVQLMADERTKVANSINEMAPAQQGMIVDFVKKVLIPLAMENNACKALECSKKELNRSVTSDRIERLSKLWDQLYTIVLPNIQSMLYPLEKYESDFNCRKYVLTAFRDRALIPVASNWAMLDKRLYQMLMVLSINTRDGTPDYHTFLRICANCLPSFPKTTVDLNSENDSESDNEVTKTEEMDDTNRRQPSTTVIKLRSKTGIEIDDNAILRSSAPERIYAKNEMSGSRPKSVQWEDMNVTGSAHSANTSPKDKFKGTLSARGSAKDLANLKKAQQRTYALSFDV